MCWVCASLDPTYAAACCLISQVEFVLLLRVLDLRHLEGAFHQWNSWTLAPEKHGLRPTAGRAVKPRGIVDGRMRVCYES